MFDFTQWETGRRFYGGGDSRKFSIIKDNQHYMLKLPEHPSITSNLSYRNSSITEHISCQIIKSIGLEVQETVLGTYQIANKTYLGVACKDFLSEGEVLIEFSKIKQRFVPTRSGIRSVSLEAILETMDTQDIFNISSKRFREFFWRQFIADTLLSNFDRHSSNWGVIDNPSTKQSRIAPIYDCASCLHAQLDREGMQNIIKNKKAMDKAIYSMPKSTITLNKNKIPHYEFLLNTDDEFVIGALVDVTKNIDISKINSIINSIECIDNLQKDFYSLIISNRYEKVLKYALEHNPYFEKKIPIDFRDKIESYKEIESVK